jgi:hypothetical protein
MSLTITIKEYNYSYSNCFNGEYVVFLPTNNIIINKYTKNRFELLCSCIKPNISFALYFYENKIHHITTRLYKNDNRAIKSNVLFSTYGNYLIHKQILIRNNMLYFTYFSYIPIDKFLYNIYSLYKYLLLLCYNNKTYPNTYNILISKKKFNCMRNYKMCCYI